jgi:hypothetical protein
MNSGHHFQSVANPNMFPGSGMRFKVLVWTQFSLTFSAPMFCVLSANEPRFTFFEPAFLRGPKSSATMPGACADVVWVKDKVGDG